MDMYRILENFDAVNSKTTLVEGQMKRQLEDRAEHMSKEDFVASAGEYGMSPKEATEFWIAVNGGDDEELDEASHTDNNDDWYDSEGRNDPDGAYDAGGHYHPDRHDVSDLDEERRSEEDWDAQALAQHKAKLAREKNRRKIQQPEKAETNEAVAPAFKPGDRVMYLNGFATVVSCDGESCGIKVDGKPGTMMVPTSQIKKPSYDESVAEGDMEEGNRFTGNLAKARAAGKKQADLDGDGDMEKVQEVFPGTPEYELRFGKDDAASAFDKKKISTGTVYSRRYKDEPESDDDAPKSAGRPKGTGRKLGAKGPSVASKLLKGKGGLKEHDDVSIMDQGEYNDEAGMARQDLHTMVDAAKELHAILASDENLPEWVQSKITKALDYIDTARDYVKSSHAEQGEESIPEAGYSAKAARAGKDIGKPGKNFAKIAKGAAERYGSKAAGERVAGAVLNKLRAKEGVESVEEKAPPGAKAERMVKHIKSGYAKDGKLTDREKAIAYATAWKAKKAGRVEEESTETKDQHAEKAGKKVTKDLEYDMKHKGKDDAKAEKAGKRVTKDIEYDDKKDKKKEVEETTVSGSVAPAAGGAAPKSKNGMQFGKGVYEGQVAESFEQKLGSILNEGMSVNVSTDDTGKKSISVNATDSDAEALGDMLKMAGLFSSEGYSRACTDCGGIHEAGACGAEQVEEELANSPDEVYADADYMTQTLSGGLNGPKTTGQTTGPVVNRQDSRQGVMAEAERVKEQAESRLWNLYKKI
jgi:hypothetical protein